MIRDSRYDNERTQAMKLLYRLLENLPNQDLPLGIIRVLVAIADHMDDRMKNISIELLCEQGFHKLK